MVLIRLLRKNLTYRKLMDLTERNDSAHDFDHFLRVQRYCKEIAEKEGGDQEILEAAALLHDIARGLEATDSSVDHLLKGAEISRDILGQIEFPKDKIAPVCYAVSVHQRRIGVKTKTLEAKILQDADLLDTYGLIYVARSILWGIQSPKYKRPLFIDEHINDFDGERDKNRSTIHYLIYRSHDPKFDPSTLNTSTAREIATRKLPYLRNFVDTFIAEWRGEF
jgi:uncharacterized protein